MALPCQDRVNHWKESLNLEYWWSFFYKNSHCFEPKLLLLFLSHTFKYICIMIFKFDGKIQLAVKSSQLATKVTLSLLLSSAKTRILDRTEYWMLSSRQGGWSNIEKIIQLQSSSRDLISISDVDILLVTGIMMMQ